jgi:type 1 glutamine amidotransferase
MNWLLLLRRLTLWAIFLSVVAAGAQPGPTFGQQTAGRVAPKTIVLICGENEYNTAATLAEFADHELAPRGYSIAWVKASPKEGDCDFKNYDSITNADLLVVSVRRRTPPRSMMERIRAHLATGRPLVGIRTASHAFDAVPPDDQHQSWSKFDQEILGANYQGHYGNKPPDAPPTVLRLIQTNSMPEVMAGVDPSFRSTSHLYKYRNLASTVTVVMEGTIEGRREVEPVAWVNTAGGRRVFYTSLGNPDDFKLPAFRQLLLNGIRWSLADPASGPSGQEEDRHGTKR